MARGDHEDDLLARAEANGYQKGAHQEEHATRDRNKHIEKTKKDQNLALDRFILWHYGYLKRDAILEGHPIPDKPAVREHLLGKGAVAPDLATMKDFLRFYAASSKGKIKTKITADSLNAFAEWFFAGFSRMTGTPTDKKERSEVYNWIRKVLTEEGLVVNIRRPKNLFTERDLRRLLETLWTAADTIFIPERYRVQFTFIFLEYCWTGARLSAFFTGGIRYKDIDLALQRDDTGGWRPIYQNKQRFVKNNRDPENNQYVRKSTVP